MTDLQKLLKKNPEIDKHIKNDRKRRQERDVSSGAGILEDDEKAYNVWRKLRGLPPVTARQMRDRKQSESFFVSTPDIGTFIPKSDHDISVLSYFDYFELAMSEINAAHIFLQEVFELSFELKELAKIACKVFYQYAFESDENLNERITTLKTTIQTIKKAYSISKSELKDTKRTLIQLGVPVPYELNTVEVVHKNYAKNQLFHAYKDAITEYLPELNVATIEIIAKAIKKN